MENLATQLTDLFAAIQCSDEKQIRRLLAANVSPYQQNTAGTTALMVAAKTGNSKIMKMLCGAAKGIPQPAHLFFSPVVSSNEKPDAVNSVMAASPFRSAPIPISGRATAVFLETSNTDDPRTNNLLPTTIMPLTGVLETGIPTPTMKINLSSFEVQTAAKAAIDTDNEPLINHEQITTQQESANPSADDQCDLKEAICRSDIDTVKALLAKGINVQAANWYDTPLLVLAAQSGSNDIVQALIKAGANTNRGYDRLPLNIASECGHFEIVHTLMRAGAYLEGQEESGYTPLMCAAAAGHLLIVQVLVDCGADVNANYYGKTPLMLAARNGHQEVYQFLYPYTRSQDMVMAKSVIHQRTARASQQARLEQEMASIFEPRRETVDIAD